MLRLVQETRGLGAIVGAACMLVLLILTVTALVCGASLLVVNRAHTHQLTL